MNGQLRYEEEKMGPCSRKADAQVHSQLLADMRSVPECCASAGLVKKRRWSPQGAQTYRRIDADRMRKRAG